MIETVAAALAVAVITWSAVGARERWDRRQVVEWLRTHTRDDPGESHVDTLAIVKGSGIPEDRERRACMSDSRIHRHVDPDGAESWSVWCEEPESVYDRRGSLWF